MSTNSSQCWVSMHQCHRKKSEKREEKERDRRTYGETPNLIPGNMLSQGMKSRMENRR